MRTLTGFMLFVGLCEGLKRTSPSNAYPGSDSGINLGNTRVNERTPMRVWSAEEHSCDSEYRGSRTDKSPWRNFTSLTANATGDGYLRYGNGTKFSSPIGHSGSLNCSLATVRNSLWTASATSPATCQCRQPLTLRLTRQFTDETRCFGAPSSVNSWPVPGLVNCTDYPDLVTNVVYHKFTGQIRSGQNCLTAAPFRIPAADNMTELYKAWAVKFSPCVGYADPYLRQSWDVPEGVGEEISSLVSTPAMLDSLGQPSGHVGRIVLRGSTDIGQRCLDIGVDLPAIPSKTPAIFMEALLCDDSRFQRSDFALWRFYRSPSNDGVTNINQWATCMNRACSDCTDGELRGIWQSNDGPHFTEPLSVPMAYEFGQTCSLDSLREMAVPSMLQTNTSRCFCQSHNILDNVASIISPNADDLPSTRRPRFPHLNTTRTSSSV